MQKLFVTLALAALALPTLADAPTKPVPPVVQKYLALVKSVKTLSVDAAQIVPPGSQTDTGHLVLAAPNRFKLTSQIGGKATAAMVSDGRTLWSWDREQYFKTDAPTDTNTISNAPPLGQAAGSLLILWLKPSLLAQTDVTDKGTVHLGAKLADKLVRSGSWGTLTVWLDAATGMPLQLKSDNGRRVFTVVLRNYTVGHPLAASAFTARPPKGLTALDLHPAPSQTQADPALLPVGSPAPDFTLPTLDGGTVSLSSLKGKPVLIDFWATWCGPCMAAMPHIQTLHQELGDAVTVLSVNTSDTKDKWASFVKKNTQYTTQMLFDGTDVSGKLYKVTGIPTVYLIDKNGNVAATYVGYDPAYEAQIKATLAKLGQ